MSIILTCAVCSQQVERRSNRQIRCPDCARAAHAKEQRAYRAANPEKVRAANKDWVARNPDLKKVIERRRLTGLDEPQKAALRERARVAHARRQEAKGIIIEPRGPGGVKPNGRKPEDEVARESYRRHADKRREAARQRYHSDILHMRMSAAVRRALRGRKAGKSVESVLGYGIDDLRSHIERQFSSKMTWQNIGAWHIDHIVPISSFPHTDEGFRDCWAITNLRPLLARDNLRKHAKRTHLI